MKDFWNTEQRSVQADDIAGLHDKVDNFSVNFIELQQGQRVASIRSKWRLLAESPADIATMLANQHLPEQADTGA